MIHGIDVSFYEPNIDWATVKGTGLANYAFIRAGQGIVADTHFGRHREGRRAWAFRGGRTGSMTRAIGR